MNFEHTEAPCGPVASCPPWARVAASVVLGFALATAVAAQQTAIGGCLNALTGRTNNSCTAQDVRVSLINVSAISDGCVSYSDTTTLQATARIDTGPDRYDIGVFVALDSLSAKTGDTCLHGYLYPPLAAPPGHDPLSGSGPYAQIDADACGDVVTGEQTFLDLPSITVPCTDTDLNGVLEIATCSSWDNNAGDNCTGLAQALPGTGAKCNCDPPSPTNVQIPNISLSKTCTASVAAPGQTIGCTVTYNNTGAGAGDFISFVDDYPEGQGSVSNLSGPPGDAVTDSGQAITWTPGGEPAAADNVAAGQTASITYEFTIDPNIPATGQVCNTATGYWSGQAQSALSVQYCVDLQATPVLLHDVTALAAPVGVEVRWRTAAESDVLGFRLWREADGERVLVSEQLLPARLDGQGGDYAVLDVGAFGEALSYLVEEVSLDGHGRWHGPYVLAVDHGADRRPLRRHRLPLASAADRAQVHRSPEGRRNRAWRIGRKGRPARLRISLDEPGLYRLPLVEIATALGRPLMKAHRELVRRRIELTNRGADVAWDYDAATRELLFHSPGPTGQFAAENIYWLTAGSGTPMPEVAAAPRNVRAAAETVVHRRLHAEADLLPSLFTTTDPSSDYWYWGGVFAGASGHDRARLELDIHGVDRSSREVLLTFEHFGLGRADSAYEAELLVNGASLGVLDWTGSGPAAVEAAVPAELVYDGPNTVELVGLSGSFLVDAIGVEYSRGLVAVEDSLTFEHPGGADVVVSGFSSPRIEAYEITDDHLPRKLSGLEIEVLASGYSARFRPPKPGGRYLVVADGARRRPTAARPVGSPRLRDQGNHGEYLIIAPEHLAPAAELLADIHRRRGLRAKVVDLSSVYDEFAYGIADPEAIRELLMHAAEVWATPPRFVTLVGKGTYDYRDILGVGTNLVPTLMRADPASLGLTASDGAFADFDGDGAPDLAVGRIPVVGESELLTYVGKVLMHLAWRNGAGWRKALALADNPDNAGDFPADMDRLAAILDGTFAVEKLYLPGNVPQQEMEALRTALADNLVDGRRLLVYVGHGGTDRLAAEGWLLAEDVDTLENRAKPSVLLGLTCSVGAFHHPRARSLAEELLLSGRGGAVSVWSPSGLSGNTAAVALGSDVLDEWTGGATATVGETLQAGAARFVAGGGQPRVPAMFNLLGDPALPTD